ncbi:heavy metal translocating P-type ATPase [Agrococcus beijingensis]|uniref:heavy metal translocating P-type ATPase n=1 Tax=Agrococcus beijingensis TaxID=3068634 RepID=UPI0027423C8A|nr:cation-translocating P-type ATPase [Agrococcus sp. REN33]
MSAECCGDDVRPAAPKRAAAEAIPNVERTAAPESATPASLMVADGDACCDPKPRASSDGDEEQRADRWWQDRALLPSIGAGVLVAAGLVLGWSGLEVAATVANVLGLILGAWTFVPGAIKRLLRGRLGVGLLMTIAAAGAVALGHVGEAAALAFLFSLAEALEDRAMDKAKDGLRALLDLIPRTARVETGGVARDVPARDLVIGDVLLVGAGELVSTDGVVIAGRSSIDTAAVTGESIPVEVAVGDIVPAGSMNGSGTLRVRATADGHDNSLTQIVALVEQAHARKGERARLADRIAKPLVPTVLVVAALVAAFGFVVGDPMTWIERALVVLVAASPCALAIAVPVTVISAIGSASRFGVVIKSGEAFEQLGTIRAVAVDKTGTLTRNAPQVVEVATIDGVDEGSVLDVAAALEATSSHPLATAIVAAASDAPNAVDVDEQPGAGISGTVGGAPARIGSTRWLDPGVLTASADRMAAAGMTVVVVEIAGAIQGVIGVRDELRDSASEAVRMLQDDGIDVVMLTGDDRRTAAALAAEVGIGTVHAQQLPRDKADFIATSAERRPTAMIGDGINDAPALAAATVGIAMGATGSAAAIESADVAFTGHDLRLIPVALRHARRGRRIMLANIVLALLIIVVLFPLALFGVLGLAGVVLVHEVAEVIVILNGVRAARRPRALPAPATSERALAHV